MNVESVAPYKRCKQKTLKYEMLNASRNAEQMDSLSFGGRPCWRPLDFGGPLRSVFLDVVGADEIVNK